MNKRPVLTLIGFIALFQIVGGFLGYLTSQEIEGWYQGLNRSPFNPPDWVFGPVWTTLYLMLAIAFWKVWAATDFPERHITLGLFTGHMILNWLWTPVFFTAHLPIPALIIIFALVFTAAMIAHLVRPIGLWVSLLFIPYIAWLTLAGHLTHYIWMRN